MPQKTALTLALVVLATGLTAFATVRLVEYEHTPPEHPSGPMKAYFAHPVSEDKNGVIAPWYKGLNGQIDERAAIAVNVYKRYPWVGKPKAVMAAPDFVYNSHWSISPQGVIAIPPTTDWMCGDLSQRAWSIVKGLTAYYQYSGDPIAFLYIPLTVDYILDYGQTDNKNPWPRFPISTPTKGKAYGKCDPTGRNQLDLCAITGTEVLRAYKLTGTPRYLAAAEHWGDVFAQKCNYTTKLSPWNRYVDPSVVGWSDVLTGTTTLITDFLDDLINLGYKGKLGLIVKARDKGRAFVNDKMLPAWITNDTWGRTYWDWDNPVICGTMSMCADHIMKNPKVYPTWKTDLRNIMALIFNRNGADQNSMGDMYSGAWAFPESSVCCGTSLSYCQYTAAPTFIRYGVLANDPWAKEIGRRMMLMATYDSDENGVVKDGLLGDSVATGEWSNLAHPWPLCQVMESLAWMPKELGANRENHLMRSSSVVNNVQYDRGKITYSTFDAHSPTVDVLRLSYVPTSVRAGGETLTREGNLAQNGFTIEKLSNGDAIVSIRHDGEKHIDVTGPDPEKQAGPASLRFTGNWREVKDGGRLATSKDATMSYRFTGNQVRVLGTVNSYGGWADAYIDGQKQLTVVECWNPRPRYRQPIFIKKGLSNGPHEVRIVARGARNTISKGTAISISGVQTSSATGDAGFGQGEGPRTAQRMVFGYTGRDDIVDTSGHAWRPATEWVVRSGFSNDTVDKAWWTSRRSMYIGKTHDEELYRYGAHGKEFWVNLTVAPGTYDLRLKFADTPLTAWMEREDKWQRVLHSVKVDINGKEAVKPMSISGAAGDIFTAIDKVVRGVKSRTRHDPSSSHGSRQQRSHLTGLGACAEPHLVQFKAVLTTDWLRPPRDPRGHKPNRAYSSIGNGALDLKDLGRFGAACRL